VDLLRAATVLAALTPHAGLAGEPVAEAIAEAEATQTATSLVSHAASTMPVAESKKFDATSPYAICFSRRNSNL
jgi:hypothetical protein